MKKKTSCTQSEVFLATTTLRSWNLYLNKNINFVVLWNFVRATCKTNELGIDDVSNDGSDVEDDEDEDVFEIRISDDSDNDSCDLHDNSDDHMLLDD